MCEPLRLGFQALFDWGNMQVKVLGRKGKSVLVEWLDERQGVQRSYVPLDSVYDRSDKSFCDLAEVGIPFGESWALLAQALPPLDGEALQRELRRVNIWTAEDLKANPAAGSSAIQQVIGLSVQQLVRAATKTQGVQHE